jgi:carboxyl-terminal processing protease
MRKSKYLRWTTVVVAALALGSATASLARNKSASKGSGIYHQLDLFEEVLRYVRADYVDKPNVDKLMEGAINGVLSGLDPHSSYLSPQQFHEMQVEETGEFGGIGLEVTMEDGLVKVVSPVSDTPAAKAGLQSGDFITAINGEDVQGLSLEEAVEKMRGPVDTPVKLTVARKGIDEPFDVKIMRDVIHITPVKYDAEDDVGYIQITTFNEQTADDLKAAIDDLEKKIGPKLRGYVIDLRNDPGGLLDQAILVSDSFLDHGEIVATKGRHRDESQEYDAQPGDITKGAKLVVLINGGSASASEIVAGALKDNHRATIVGTRSFGKGSVQTIIPLRNKGALRLTTARYYTPSGRSIQAEGIKPDYIIAEKIPPDLKNKIAAEDVVGEANLPHHLQNEDDGGSKKAKDASSKGTEDGGDKSAKSKEQSGSAAYVNPDKKADTQLQYALDLLRGTTVNIGAPERKADAK